MSQTTPHAKLLDFGLAKASAPVVAGAGLSGLPTTPLNLTVQGSILGTLPYMAPEQIEGQDADARTDVFAFGAVLYEMLTGRKAFEGRSPASLMGAILKEQPAPIATLQPLVQPALDRVVSTCLAKDPDDRWQTAGDLLRELRWLASADPGTPAPPAATHTRSVPLAVAALAVWAIAATALGVWTVVTRPPASPEQPEVRFEVSPPPGTRFGVAPALPLPALSPDGRYLVFSAGPADERDASLWVRRLDQTEAHALPGTTGGSSPFWSPDSRHIAFYAARRLKRVPLDGGPVQTLADMLGNHRGTWNNAGDILFDAPGGGIARVSAAGGTPTVVTTLNAEERAHFAPAFLPDGDHFLFLTAPDNVLKAASITAAVVKPLGLRGVSHVRYAPPGYLLYVTQATLVARPFDARQLEFRGEPTTIATSLRSDFTGRAPFDISLNGVLTYRQNLGRTIQAGWFTREGKLLEEPVAPGDHRAVGLSPDGHRFILRRVLAADGGDSRLDALGGGTLSVVDTRRRTDTRLTAHPSVNLSAHWSPDGRAVVFASNRDPLGLYIKHVDTASDEELLLSTTSSAAPTDWSSDGRLILYEQVDVKTGNSDISVLTLADSTRESTPFLHTPFNEGQATLSADGRWIAYTSDESGRFQVYVQPFPATREKWQVSSTGGSQPRWRRDGRELLFVDASGAVMATPIAVMDGRMSVGQPQRLFGTSMDVANPASPGVENMRWAVSADGQRFLILNNVGTTNTEPLVVVLNWLAALTP